MHDAYVFWIAAARDAAYQLLLPTERARLHALALDSLDHDTPPEELAEHARLAQEGGGNQELRPRELAFTRQAAREALKTGRYFDGARLCARWAQLSERDSADFSEATLGRANALSSFGRAREAEACAREAVRAARTDALASSAWRVLCEVLYLAGRYEDSLEAGEQAVAMAERAGDTLLLGACLNSVLSPLREMARFEQYQALTRRVCDLAANDSRLNFLAHSSMGHACMTQGDIANATLHFSRVQEECLPLINQRLQLNNLLCLGQCYCRTADVRAHATLALALSKAQALGDRILLGMTESALGVLAYESGRSDEAEAHYAAAQAFAEEVGDDMMLAIALGNRGSALSNGGHFDAALACYSRAEEVNARLNRPVGSAINRMNRGVVLRIAGRTIEALACLRDAAEALRTLGARGPRVFALCESVMLLLMLGRAEEARALHAEAQAAAEGMSETRVRAMLHESRAQLRRLEGDLAGEVEDLQIALAQHEQEGLARPMDALRLRIDFTRALIKLGRRDEARACIKLARIRATETKAAPDHPLPHVREHLADLAALERELA